MIMGLGIARLLISAVGIFRAREDGRWALIALAFFNLAIGVINFRRGGWDFTKKVLLNFVFATMALAAFFGTRPVQVLASLACPPIIVWGVVRLAN